MTSVTLWKKFSILAAVVLMLATWRPALALALNVLIDLVQVGTPSLPGPGNSRLFVNAVTHQLSCLNGDGSSCLPGSGSGSIQPLNPPVASNFTQLNFNQGGATTVQYNNSAPVTSISLSQSDPGSAQETAGIVKNKIGSTFTITLGCSMNLVTSQGLGGLFLYDGSSNNMIFGAQNLGTYVGAIFSNLTGNFTGYSFGPVNGTPTGPLAWYRVQETGSARNYYMSTDGINFTLVQTESNSAHFVTSQYGWATQERGSGSSFNPTMMTAYSFTETNP